MRIEHLARVNFINAEYVVKTFGFFFFKYMNLAEKMRKNYNYIHAEIHIHNIIMMKLKDTYAPTDRKYYNDVCAKTLFSLSRTLHCHLWHAHSMRSI